MKIKPTYKSILNISPYTPGEKANSKNKNIKLSSNENPFGCSEQVKSAISNNLEELHRYPEGSSLVVRHKIAETYKLDEGKIICGAGSDEIITLICMAYAAGEGNEVLYSEHGFLMYPISAQSVGAKAVTAKENNLKTDINAIINAVNDNTKLIFIANPNNPTGSYITDVEAEKLMDSVPQNVVVVLDCAYQEYAEIFDDYPNALKLADKYDNLIVTRTFSKAYGIPALRLGWAYSNNEIIDVLNRVRGPFNVGSLAQIAGVAALGDVEFIRKSVKHNSKYIKHLQGELKALGLKFYPSAANFLLIDFESESKAIEVDKQLRANGITGRMMQAYSLPTCMRFTIGLEEEMETLIENLKNIV